jgi:hypothetical protein
VLSTSDGRWWFRRVEPANGGIRLAGTGVDGGSLRSAASMPIGPASSEPYTHCRIEIRISATNLDPDASCQVALAHGNPASGVLADNWITFTGDGSVSTVSAGRPGAKAHTQFAGTGAITLALEVRERWIYMFFNGQLVAVAPVDDLDPTTLLWIQGPTAAGNYIDIDYVLVRRTRPYLLRGTDRGDYRLPGAPPPGGLLGSYFSEVATSDYRDLLSPLNSPYARRLDPVINFVPPDVTPNEWQPPGTPAGEHFTARWTGSIYLDDPATWAFRTRQTSRARVWIGKTRFGEQIINDWPAGGNAGINIVDSAPLTQLGHEPGWYPIIIEYSAELGPCGIILEGSQNGGPWVRPNDPSDGSRPAFLQLSPLGIFEDHVRGESHSAMVKQLMDTFGYQYLCEPMQLESGEFPGRVAPRVRVGTDYDVELSEDDDTDLQVQVTAEDCVDVLMADAQGLADPTGSAQLSAEVINFPGIDQHVMVHSEAESLSEISNPELLLQRLNSLLALRSAPFEQATATILTEGGERKLVPIPLSDALGEIAWRPGDGLRRRYPVLGIEDDGYVQLTVVTRKFVPDALGLPAVSFRPRTRTFRDFLARLQRQAIAPQRNYQGQLATVQGTRGSGWNADNSGNYQLVDSVAPLPTNIADVKQAELVISDKVVGTDFHGDVAEGDDLVRQVADSVFATLILGSAITGPGIPAGATVIAIRPRINGVNHPHAFQISAPATGTYVAATLNSEFSDQSEWGITVSGQRVSTFMYPGRFDITPFIAPRAAGQPALRVGVVGLAGSTGKMQFTVELKVAI